MSDLTLPARSHSLPGRVVNWVARPSRVLILLFLVAILTPLLAKPTTLTKRNHIIENRWAAQPPTWSRDLKAMARQTEAYFNDRMGMRSSLVALHGDIVYRGLGDSTSRRVQPGRESWLYLTDASATADYLGKIRLSERAKQKWEAALEERRAWLAERGIPYLFVIAPSKQWIYPEYLPAYLGKPTGPSRVDQFLDYARRKGIRTPILDLRPVLLANKGLGQLYARGDSHWNLLGGSVGYRAIIEALVPLGVSVPYVQPPADQLAVTKVSDADLAAILGMRISEHSTPLLPQKDVCGTSAVLAELAGVALQPTPAPVIRADCPTGQGRLLMFRDSFGRAEVTFLPQSFAHSTFIWDFPNLDGFKTLVETVKPDVVIDQRVDRVFEE